MDDLKQGGIAIIDYGSQYTQLIARRVRELGVYSEVFAHDGTEEHINQHDPAGYILSGGPNSVYEKGAPYLPSFILDGDKPIFGICYGMQLLTHALGGTVAPSSEREYGSATITHTVHNPLLDGLDEHLQVWMSHGDRIEAPPISFTPLAQSENSPYAAIGDVKKSSLGGEVSP